MKKIIFILMSIAFILVLTQCGEKEDVKPIEATVLQDTTITTVTPSSDTSVKFTLYSKRVPYIWKRVVNGKWVQDTIKTNNAVKYEPYDKRNLGIGYWATMNLNGKSTDSLHIIGEYKGKMTQMASLKGQSAAYCLLDAIKPL